MESTYMCAAGVPVFQSLSQEELQELGKSMRHRQYRKGQIIAVAGEPVKHLFIVARGRLNLVHTSSSGREQVVRTAGPGESFGELALFTQAVFEGNLICAEDTEVCLLHRDSVQLLMARNQDVALRLAETLAHRLSKAEGVIAGLGLKDVGQRLARELLLLAEHGDVTDAGVVIKIPVPWAEVAARIGTTPETLSRRLGAFADQGIIRQEGARLLVILDPEKLHLLARA